MTWNNWLLVLLLISYSYCENKKDSDSDEIFEPTKEWKVIKEGQKVPAGLHYRINLATGKKEAKINDETESEKGKEFSLVQSEDAGKNEQEKKVKKFRTLDEIKKSLGDVDITPKSDEEILKSIFAKYKTESKKQPASNEIVFILRELVYLGHQIDNGNVFVKMDGFKNIIYRELNSTSNACIQEALTLFSTLAQNNPLVKVHVLETGGVTILLRLLYQHENHQIQSGAITALSCTLRTFPYAQNNFFDSGGLTIFTNLFKTDSIKLKLKLVTLLTDFVIERQTDSGNFKNVKYVDLEARLVDLGWCENLSTLLEDLINSNVFDHDLIEKCLVSMKALVKKCGKGYKTGLLKELHLTYKTLDEQDQDGDSYFKSISATIDLILNESKSDKEEL